MPPSPTPLVVFSGLGGEPEGTDAKIPSVLVPVASKITESPVVTAAKQQLEARASSVKRAKSRPQFALKWSDSVRLYKKTDRASPLSPKNPESPLHPDQLFTPQWLTKYERYWPAVLVVWHEFKVESDIERIVESINTLKLKIRETKLVVIVTAPSSVNPQALTTVVAELRYATGLAPRTGMLTLLSDSTPKEIDTFVLSLWQLLETQVAEFFTNRSREMRRKRDSLPSTQDALGTSARYTLKLALFSEFKGDAQGALRLYESTYDSIRQLFDNGLKPSQTSWKSTRECIDLVAIKIAESALRLDDPGVAYKKFRYHIRSVAKLLHELGLLPLEKWLASAYWSLANLVQSQKGSSRAFLNPAQSPVVALPRAGILYFEAAKLASYAESPPNDPYVVEFDVNDAYERAYSDLKSFPRTAGLCLMLQAEWQENQNAEKALSKYQLSLNLLGHSWPHSKFVAQKVLELSQSDVDKAVAKLSLLLAGQSVSDHEPIEIGRYDVDLFTVTGTFRANSSYLGRTLNCQVTLTPKFAGKLRLSALKIILTDQSVSLEHANVESSPLQIGNKVNLEFNGHAKTFELGLTVSEPKDLVLQSVHIFGAAPVFLQECPVRPGYSWVQSPVGPATTRHLQLPNPRSIEILSRPPQLELDLSAVPEVVAPGETVLSRLMLLNKESEASHATVTVHIVEEDIPDSKCYETLVEVPPGDTLGVEHTFLAPRSSFGLRVHVSYTTDSDKMPVRVVGVTTVETATPFRSTFDLVPRLHPDPWPSLFVPSSTDLAPVVMRAWQLQASLVPLASNVELHEVKLELESSDAVLILDNDSYVPAKREGSAKAVFNFVAKRADRDLRTFTGRAHLTLQWSRQNSEIKNSLAVPPLRLSLMHQEPRALLVVEKLAESLRLEYILENNTTHILKFAVTLASSADYGVEGPKGVSLRLLPYSRRSLEYQLVPLQGTDKPLPALRVFDTQYKRALEILPASDNVYKGAHGIYVST